MLTPEGYEQLLVKLLFVSEEIRDRINPYLVKEVFSMNIDTQRVFESLRSYEHQYEKFPTENEFSMFLKTEPLTAKWNEIRALDVSEDLADSKSTLDQIESYIKYKLVFLAKDEMTDALLAQDFGRVVLLQEKISDALGFTFDQEIAIEPFDNIDKIYEELTKKDACITTGIKSLDKSMGGGWPTKTLNLVIAGVNIGKTHFMCSNALEVLKQGFNVLYITFEDGRAEVARRVFQNLCSIKREDTMIKDSFMKIFNREKKAVKGKMRIYEAEGGSYSTTRLYSTLKDLKMKNNFVPDIIFLDYLAYMSTVKGGRFETHERLKVVAQELKAMAFKTGIPIVSAAQLNRTGFNSKNPGLEDLAECFALSAIADNAWVFTTNEELYNQKMMSAILTKSRVGGKYSKFLINCDPDIQRMWSTEENEAPKSVRDEDLLDDYNINQLKKIKDNSKEPKKISYELF